MRSSVRSFSKWSMSQTLSSFFFFNDTATTEIYTLSLHDALPISFKVGPALGAKYVSYLKSVWSHARDRKSTRLNSSHSQISYAVFCLKKKQHCTRRGATGGLRA